MTTESSPASSVPSATPMEGTMTTPPERPDFCGVLYWEELRPYTFWFDGVLVSVIAIIGFVGNLLALIVLSRPKLRDVFHQLLLALAAFDLMYIVCGGINYTFRAFEASSDIYSILFPYLIYPMTHVAVAGTIFMTVAISIERYLGLCYPFLPPHSRKAWFYVVPVVFISFALNVPKFMEVELVWEKHPETGGIGPAFRSTQLRFDETYIRAYIMWTRLFSTAVIPVVLLLYLNTRIIYDLCTSKVQRFGSARRQRKEINLCLVLLCIVLVFFLCHTGRIIMDVHEFSNVEKVIACKKWQGWFPSFWSQALLRISHTMIILNSSVNFVIYCLVGQMFRRELCRALGVRSYTGIASSTAATGGTGGVGVANSRRESDNNAKYDIDGDTDVVLGNGNGHNNHARRQRRMRMRRGSSFEDDDEEEEMETFKVGGNRGNATRGN